MTTDLGRAWAQAVSDEDDEAIRALLHDDRDFRAVTPRRIWEAEGAHDVLAALDLWFGDTDRVSCRPIDAAP